MMRDLRQLNTADLQAISSIDLDIDDINPGHLLRRILEVAIPFEANSESSFVKRIDGVIKAEDEFSYLLYQSSINYLTRRLISTASFLKVKYDKREEIYEDIEERILEPFPDRLRSFLTEFTDFEGRLIEILIPVLQRCLDTKNQSRKLSRKKKKRIRKNQTNEHGELRCYICGCSLSESNPTFEVEDLESDAEPSDKTSTSNYVFDIIEHVWPKGLGGSRKEFNLKVSCNRCTDDKQEYIDFSDFHYEEICVAKAEEEDNFEKDFKRIYKVALWSKNNYSCTICGAKAEEVGRLTLKRRNPEDGWHFLNVDSYCESCASS
jgi:hypothetical protein